MEDTSAKEVILEIMTGSQVSSSVSAIYHPCSCHCNLTMVSGSMTPTSVQTNRSPLGYSLWCFKHSHEKAKKRTMHMKIGSAVNPNTQKVVSSFLKNVLAYKVCILSWGTLNMRTMPHKGSK